MNRSYSYRWPNGPSGQHGPSKTGLGPMLVGLTHGLHQRSRHNPIRLGPYSASQKARQPIMLLHRINLFLLPHLSGLVSYMDRISLILYLSSLWAMSYMDKLILFWIPQLFLTARRAAHRKASPARRSACSAVAPRKTIS